MDKINKNYKLQIDKKNEEIFELKEKNISLNNKLKSLEEKKSNNNNNSIDNNFSAISLIHNNKVLSEFKKNTNQRMFIKNVKKNHFISSSLNNSINHNSIGHTVDYMFFKTYGLNNPFGFIKINRVYDLSNYIKYKFFINKINYDELDLILSFLSIDEKIFLFSCLLYPNIYFDLIKHILLNEEKEKKVLLFIKRIKSYKRLLQYIKNEIKDVKDISFINWLNT